MPDVCGVDPDAPLSRSDDTCRMQIEVCALLWAHSSEEDRVGWQVLRRLGHIEVDTMPRETIELLVRWLGHHDETNERVSAVLVAALFLSDCEGSLRLMEHAPAGSFDEALAEEFLAFAKPPEVAELLVNRLGPLVSPSLFERLFTSALEASANIETVSRLVFAAGLFLDLHPGAFPLPYQPTRELLASSDFDQRLAGLKALRHTSVAPAEFFQVMASALKSNDDMLIGLTQLAHFLDQRSAEASDIKNQQIIEKLQTVLGRIMQSDREMGTRHTAAYCQGKLRAIADSRSGSSRRPPNSDQPKHDEN